MTVLLDGQPQSYVDPDDPGLLAFEYVHYLGLVADLTGAKAPAALAVTHIGGAGLTLARYVQHTRPGSPQIVLEPDTALTEQVRAALPLPRGHRIRVRGIDGANGIGALTAAGAGLLVLDAFAGGQVPAALTTVDFFAEVARVLRPGGVFALNIADQPNRRYLARVLATLAEVADPHAERPGHRGFTTIATVATSDVGKGRRFGNHVVVAARRGGPSPFDADDLARAVARSALPTTVRSGAELTRLASSAAPLTSDRPMASPAPPSPGSWRAG